MLKQLLSIWQEDSLLSKSDEQFNEMLNSLRTMFGWSMDYIWHYEKGKSAKEIYDQDIKINKAERKIRKRIVEHLSIQPGIGVSQCLVLMSIGKDAERIGDYCKNLLEVAVKHGVVFKEDSYVDELKTMQGNIDEMFEKTMKCLRQDSMKIANTVHEMATGLNKDCEQIILKVYESNDLDVRSAISYVLLSRFLKRIVSHLGNISTSVSMPVHKLDYFDEKVL